MASPENEQGSMNVIGDILQPTHLLIILAAALLLLGPKRLPEAGKALGRSITEFRSEIRGIHDAPATESTPTSSH